MRFLTAIPVFNEARHIDEVLAAARPYAPEMLVIDDGSTDETPQLLRNHRDIKVIRHESNAGYGAALRDAFRYAIDQHYDALVTMDCDGQHEPARIPQLMMHIDDADIVSGSRYLEQFDSDSIPPEDRRRINMEITAELNRRFGLALTDGFCGFKAYRTDALAKLDITEPGYGMPLELWIEAAALGFRIREVAVPLIYLDERRAFGGSLDDAQRRRAYYYEVMERAANKVANWRSGAPRGAVPRDSQKTGRPSGAAAHQQQESTKRAGGAA